MIFSYKSQFPRARQVVYLDTAAEGLPAPGVRESFEEYCRDKALGTPGRKQFHAMEEETRSLAARLLGTDAKNIAFLGSASEALTALAGSLELRLGDRVIVSDIEFPSNILPWLRLREAGVEVKVVPSQGGTLLFEDVAQNITSRTRLISLSLVSYKTGAYLPFVPMLATEAQRVGAVVAIDATQAFGCMPLSLEGIDYLVSSSFKWLLGPHGVGIVYVSPELRQRLKPQAVGWYSVVNCFTPDRFDRYELKTGAACLSTGMPNFPSLYALRRSLQFLLEADIDALHNQTRPVVERIWTGIAELGFPLLTPAQSDMASNIIAFEHADADRLGAALEGEGVIVWAGDGRVRASVHLYNNSGDAERYLQALRTVMTLGKGLSD